MSEELNRSLRTSHRTVLVMIALCAVLSAIQPDYGDDDAPDPTLTSVAIALGLATVLARGASNSAVISLRTRTTLLLCAYACALSLAMLGAFVAMTRGQSQVGLLYALAAGIFSFRRPSSLDTNDSRTT